jgi:hypothetical protein
MTILLNKKCITYIFNDDSDEKKIGVLTTSHEIQPFVDFKLNALFLPLHLTKIVLGSKCPENQN